jgi:hypothetical protein
VEKVPLVPEAGEPPSESHLYEAITFSIGARVVSASFHENNHITVEFVVTVEMLGAQVPKDGTELLEFTELLESPLPLEFTELLELPLSLEFTELLELLLSLEFTELLELSLSLEFSEALELALLLPESSS